MLNQVFFLIIEYCSPDEPKLNFTTEGCFCPDGSMLFNKESNICVDKCGKYDFFPQVILIIKMRCQKP